MAAYQFKTTQDVTISFPTRHYYFVSYWFNGHKTYHVYATIEEAEKARREMQKLQENDEDMWERVLKEVSYNISVLMDKTSFEALKKLAPEHDEICSKYSNGVDEDCTCEFLGHKAASGDRFDMFLSLDEIAEKMENDSSMLVFLKPEKALELLKLDRRCSIAVNGEVIAEENVLHLCHEIAQCQENSFTEKERTRVLLQKLKGNVFFVKQRELVSKRHASRVWPIQSTFLE